MKLLIVDDQTSAVFKIFEHLQNYSKLEKDYLKIASNGMEALAVAEKDNFDLILMDIQMPIMNGINATKKLISKYSDLNIIIISSSNDEKLIQQSKNAGAKGYLLKENISTSLISAIETINNGYAVFPNKTKLLKSNSLNLNCIHTTKAFYYEFVKYEKRIKANQLILTNIIKAWINKTKSINFVTTSFSQFFEDNPITSKNLVNLIVKGNCSKCNLIEEFEIKFKSLILKHIDYDKINKYNFPSKINNIDKCLNSFLYTDVEEQNSILFCLKSRLEANAQVVRADYAKKFIMLINLISSKTSPAKCLDYFESAEDFLNISVKRHRNELNNLLEKEKATVRAYNKLRCIFQTLDNVSKSWFGINSMINAISQIYITKIEIEAFILVIQVVEKLIQLTQFAIDDIILTINLLEDTCDLLSNSNVSSNIFSFVQHEPNVLFDYSALLEETETEFGYSINQWGSRAGITSNVILDKLINKIYF